MIEEAEDCKAALPFDLVLRLAGVLGRNDPISFALKLTRSKPGIWKALDDLGVGKLVVQAGRERDFANLYRANDAARRLTDEDFAHVLKFVGSAFDMAVGFHASQKARRAKPPGAVTSRMESEKRRTSLRVPSAKGPAASRSSAVQWSPRDGKIPPKARIWDRVQQQLTQKPNAGKADPPAG